MVSKIAIRVDRLRNLRERRGWSQREMSRLCDFGEGQIRKYENEESDPSATHLKRIAELLNVSADFLLGMSDDPQRTPQSSTPDEDETQILKTFHDEGWTGVIRLGAERLSK